MSLVLSRRSVVLAAALGGGRPLIRCAAAATAAQDQVADTVGGRVRGMAVGGVLTFRGIPYGASTAGDRRFLPPIPPESWSGIRDATRYGPRAPQLKGRPGLAPGSDQPVGEDCLVLNIWTPALDGRRRPVMVWLHPGGFASGGGSDYTGSGMLTRKEDVVLVEVNHRLGILGFLDLSAFAAEFATSGIVGMQDIVLALRWVRQNVDAFGGDPSRVTVFGESGGGSKVSTLMAMPEAKGLFHRAIAQSGSYIRGIPPADAADTTDRVFQHLGLRTGDVATLRRLPTAQLLDAFAAITAPTGALRRTFSPVVGSAALPHDPFDPAAPLVSADVPFIAGTTSDETTILLGLLAPDPKRMFALDEAGLLGELTTWLGDVHGADATALIRSYRSRRPDATPSDLYFAITGDRLMRVPAIVETERKAALGGALAWSYLFAWDKSPLLDGRMKAHHGAELGFVFDTIEPAAPPDHRLLADQMRGAWAAFARTGIPRHASLPKWPAYDARTRATLILDMPSRVENDPRTADRIAMEPLVTGWSGHGPP